MSFVIISLKITIGKNGETIMALNHVVQCALNDYTCNFFCNCMSQVLA
jgi:hypothetical protein